MWHEDSIFKCICARECTRVQRFYTAGITRTSRRNVVTVISLIRARIATLATKYIWTRTSRSHGVADTFRALERRMRETKIVGQIASSLSPAG